MRQKLRLKGKRSAALAMCGALSLSFLAGGIATAAGDGRTAFADNSDTISVNAGMKYQTLDGWGSTLAWWANEIGDWTKPSATGTTQREYVMELLYGKDGLDWNIARYNIGGGDDPTHTHMPDARNMPGFKAAREKTDEEKADKKNPFPGNFVPDDYYCFQDQDGLTKSWEETTDYNQLWVLNWIQTHRDDTMTEFFSNSPPYWMTVSGCSSGHETKGKPNLRDEYIEAYVEYFLDVYEYLVSQGFTFDYLQPFNESSSAYWPGFTGSQEGCDFSTAQKIDVLALLQDEVEYRGLDIGYNFSDETKTDTAIKVFLDVFNSSHVAPNGMTGKDILYNADKLTYHIYNYNEGTYKGGMSWLRRAANLFGKEVEMSEICFSNGSKHDIDDMTTAFTYSASIIDVLKYGGAQSYIFWQGVEDKVGQMNGGSNYGLLQGVYKSADADRVTALGLSVQDVTTSKAYYVSGQYSKYMKRGYSIVECVGDGSLAAVSPDGGQLVIVKENNDKSSKEITFDLDGFTATNVTKITTDETRNWAKEYLNVSGTSFKNTVTANSVTTYVIDGIQTKGDSHFIDSSDVELKSKINKIENDDKYTVKPDMKYALSEIDSSIADNPEKEALYLTFDDNDCAGIGNDEKAKNYLYGGTYYTNNSNHYVVVRFKGTGFGIVALQKKDAGTINIWIDPETENFAPAPSATAIEANLKQSEQINRKEVYRYNGLDDGWHTVYVAPKSGWFNFDGFFAITEADKTADSVDAPVLLNAAAYRKDGRLYASFTGNGALTSDGYAYFMEYRRPGGEWIRSTAEAVEEGGVCRVSDTPSFNAASYDVRIVAVNGKDVRPSSSKIVYVNDVYAGGGLLYFVDCGTGDFSNKYAGRILGAYNSVYDQPYGKDVVTGLEWGCVGKTSNDGYHAADDPLMSFESGDYYTDGVITYKFTIPEAGNYRIALGTYNAWDLRYADVALTSDAGVSVTRKNVASEKSARVEVLEFVTTTENEEITLTVTKAQGSDNPTLSLIAVTDTATAIPLYADAVSNYTEGVDSVMASLAIGTNFMADGLKAAEIKVTMSDGKQEICSVNNGKAQLLSVTLDSVEHGSAIQATYVLDFNGMSDMTVQKSFQAAQSGIEVYYNIDCGTDGTKPGTPGTKQGSAYDQEDDGTTWGYVEAAESYWKNDKTEISFREFNENKDAAGYNLRGFKPNENLKVTIGASMGNWGGSRTVTVTLNGVAQSQKVTTAANNPGSQVYTVNADANGELEVYFTCGNNKSPIAFVRVESVPTGGDSLITTVPDALTADKTSYTPSNDGEKIVLSNAAQGATVYVLDSEDNFVDCISVAGTANATPSYTALEWNNWAAVGQYAEKLRFVQAFEGNNKASAELTVSLSVKPRLDVRFDSEALEDGSVIVLRFTPKFPEDSTREITGLSLRLPDEYGIKNADGTVTRVEVDIIDSFFFRTVYNGDYTALMKVDGVTYEYPFTVDAVDVIGLKVEKSEAFESAPVTVTLTPEATKGVNGITVNGEAKQLTDGKFEFTATENGEYKVVVISKSGFRKEFTVAVNNIEPETPTLNIALSYNSASGVKVSYTTNSAGGRLYVSVNGAEGVAVETEFDLLASEDGKYEFYYTNGAQVSSAKKTYYVTHNARDARLGTVTVDKKGNVSVSGATAKLYRAGEGAPLGDMNVSANGKYYLELTSEGGTELVVVNTSTGLDIDWAGVSNVVDIALTVVFSVAALGLVAGIIVIAATKRRKS